MKSQFSIFLLLCSFCLLLACSGAKDQDTKAKATKTTKTKKKNKKKASVAEPTKEELKTIAEIDQLVTGIDGSVKAINQKAKETEEGVQALLKELTPTK